MDATARATEMIYPIRYYYRGKVSDKQFILDRMHFIPKDKQQEVSDNYDRLFLPAGGGCMSKCRKEANTYLHAEAMKYKTENKHSESKEDYRETLKRQRETQAKPATQEIKKPTASGVVNMKPIPKEFKGIQLDW